MDRVLLIRDPEKPKKLEKEIRENYQSVECMMLPNPKKKINLVSQNPPFGQAVTVCWNSE